MVPIRVPREVGGIQPSFKQKHNLIANLKPWEFAYAFLPFKHKEKYDDLFSFEKLTKWMKLKGIMIGAGSRIYKDE